MSALTASVLFSLVLGVPYVRQDSEGCGAAALSMIMQYWLGRGATVDRAAADPDRIFRQLFRPELHGIEGKEMQDYLRRNGFAAFAVPGEPSDLEAQLAKGRPLVACLRITSNRMHYVVVIGQATPGGVVRIHDPQRGPNLPIPWKDFAAAWKAAGYWLLVAAPPD